MTRYGSETPRIYTKPLRELTPETSLGYSVIDFVENVLGERLFPWQRWLYIHALEIEGDMMGEWRFRYRTIVMIVGRQNGKTQMSKWLVLWFLYILGVPLVIGTAQNLAMAEEVWEAVVATIEDNKHLAAEFINARHSNGNKELILSGRRRYKIAPLSRKGGRGFSADLVLMDELREHQTWEAWAAVSKTLLTREHGILWCISNAGDASSVVLRHLRLKSHELLGDPDGVCKQLKSLSSGFDDEDDNVAQPTESRRGYFEWSAPPGAAITDRDAWAQANPSLGYLITEDVLAAAAEEDDEAKFRTECLCQWIESSFESVFPGDSWERSKDENSYIAPDSEITYGIDISPDYRHVSIAACGRRPDRSWHVEVIAYAPNTKTALDMIRHRAAVEGQITVAYQGKGAPVLQIADSLEQIQGVQTLPCEGPDVTAWHGRFYAGIAARESGSESSTTPIYHRPQPVIDLAQLTAATRSLGDGGWAFNRKDSPTDVSALIACVMALGAATSDNKPKRVSAYSDGHDLVFL